MLNNDVSVSSWHNYQVKNGVYKKKLIYTKSRGAKLNKLD